jgi:hypothetical protein
MNMLYEIGSPDVYYVGDRRRGTIQASRVVAGAQDFKNMIGNYGDLCKAHTNTMTISAGIATGTCGPANNSTVEYKCNGVVLVNLGASVTAQEIVVTESVGFQFVELEYK